MTALFIHLYLDEDVSIHVAEILHSRGFDVLTTLAAGRLGSKDIGQVEFAAAEHRTFLTHNRKDFEALAKTYFASGKQHAGIILMKTRRQDFVVQPSLAAVVSLAMFFGAGCADQASAQPS